MHSTRPRVDLAAMGLLDDLPSPPVVAMEILRLGKDPDTGLDELATVLSRDAALASKVIRIANAAAYRRRGEVVSVQDAAARLGLRTLEVISLGFSLVGDHPKSGELAGMSLHRYWRRSLTTAVLARRIASEHLPALAQEAFIVGLFSQLGRMVLAERATRRYEPVVVAGDGWPDVAAEREALGHSTLDVTAALLRSWDLPSVMIDAAEELVLLHHSDEGDVSDLVGVVSVAMAADAVLDEPSRPGLSAILDERVERHLGPDGSVEELLVTSRDDVAEACAVFEVELDDSFDPSELLAQSRKALIDASLTLAEDLEAEERRSQALVREVRELEERVREDSLTRLPNRSALDEFLERELDLRRRGSRQGAIGILVIDIDRFKSLNDRYGHQAGDDVLRLVAATLSQGCRRGELLARYGGEEFVLVAPSCTVGDLMSAGERLRKDIEHLSLVIDGHDVGVTISIGGACAKDAELFEDGDRLIQKADGYLYRAKRRGRNRVEICPDDLL